jgi:mono/diheme cytochrome c family protein
VFSERIGTAYGEGSWLNPGSSCGDCHAIDGIAQRVAGKVGPAMGMGPTNVASGQINYQGTAMGGWSSTSRPPTTARRPWRRSIAPPATRSMRPRMGEPLFQGLSARISFNPVMNMQDFQAGLARLPY